LELAELTRYCDELLLIRDFDDYCPNGLQIEGRGELQLLVTGVSACQALIDAAVVQGADALLVHHGFFWKGESPCIRGMKGRRIRTLIEQGISLLAYHLPLDAHSTLGNNAALARVLGIREPAPVEPASGSLLWQGRVDPEQAAQDFAATLEAGLGRKPLVISGGDQPLRSIAWCTGAAQGYIEQAALLGVDAYLSGEISEQTVHQARELGVHYFAAGHHATESFGVQALGQHLARHFGIEHRHIDIPNPV
jgi:dinuclear metal center YbgI/SA1388 family protein